MNFEEFKQKIIKDKPSPVYLFFGEADFLKEEALKWYEDYLMTKTSGNLAVEVIQHEIGLDELVENANTVPLFYANKLLILRDVNYFSTKRGEIGKKADRKSEEKAFLKYLEDPNPTTFIILLAEGKPDSRKSIFNSLNKAGMVLELNQLKGRALLEWAAGRFAAHQKRITPQALDYLITCVGNDLSLLEHEITKLILFSGEEEKDITLAIVEEVVSKTSQVTIFNLVDAVAEGRGVEANKHCQELLKQGEKEFFITYMLARQFRLIIEAKLLLAKGYSQSQLPQILQTQGFAIRKALKQGNKFSVEQLAVILDKLLSLDVAIKTGKGNSRLLLEVTIAELCY
jgi:DNA polymerase-3 subunit delta